MEYWARFLPREYCLEKSISYYRDKLESDQFCAGGSDDNDDGETGKDT